jgi:hypothetical protein
MPALIDTRMPGVYTQEIPTIPPSIALVPTAVPVFIGYTKTHSKNGDDVKLKTVRVRNMREYQEWFGGPDTSNLDISVDVEKKNGQYVVKNILTNGYSLKHRMYYAMQLYYANGGGPCYILSLGQYPSQDGINPYNADVENALKKNKDITIIVMPDAVGSANNNDAYNMALKHCSTAINRVTIIDVNDKKGDDNDASGFRTDISSNIDEKKYGAAYYPFLNTNLEYVYDYSKVSVANYFLDGVKIAAGSDSLEGHTLNNLELSNNALYNLIKDSIRTFPLKMPPSPAIAGLYVTTDLLQGVWKAPANASLSAVISPSVEIDDDFHANLNVDTSSGKSINAIRAYTGRGILVYGARTLAGNDLEWRYISVRRTFCFIEDSIQRAMLDFVFAPNTRETWIKVKAMINNFLNEIWKAGGLFGDVPADAYQVNVGQPETMTDVDILEGRMIIEIKLRVSRPAEFIILRYEHKFNANTN